MNHSWKLEYVFELIVIICKCLLCSVLCHLGVITYFPSPPPCRILLRNSLQIFLNTVQAQTLSGKGQLRMEIIGEIKRQMYTKADAFLSVFSCRMILSSFNLLNIIFMVDIIV